VTRYVVVSLSVVFRKVRGMSEDRFRRTPEGCARSGCTWCGARSIGAGFWGGRVASRCGELLGPVADGQGWEIVAKVMPDRVHLFIRVGPIDAPPAVVRAFKGRTARVLGAEFRICAGSRRCCARRRISPPRSGMSRSRRFAATSSTSGMR
jgi:putative transposase